MIFSYFPYCFLLNGLVIEITLSNKVSMLIFCVKVMESVLVFLYVNIIIIVLDTRCTTT